MTRYPHSRFQSGVVLALVILNLAFLAFVGWDMWSKPTQISSHQQPGPHAPRPKLGKFIQQELNLTPEQVSRFQELKRIHRQENRQISRRIKSLRESLFDSLNKSMTEIDSLTQAIGQEHQQRERSTYQHFSDLRAICTPEQQSKLDQMLQDVLLKVGPIGGPGPHGHPPGPPPHGRERNRPPH